ncbi:MAG: 23S rRNA (adenine(2503)-C(2))-methyltransferase RlmN [Planctomycetota bacterium]|jgi:23S rRNA (adenine2503-C2)-methyltransferase|nr:23S rRNA (adenine(2503)-C(2))-methyltransferase RlmN [Planctomycetota bacterium]
MKDLLNHHPSAWPDLFEQVGVAKFHGRNAARWVFHRGAKSWGEMTDLPASLRDKLEAQAPLGCAKLLTTSGAKDGAEKVLLELEDGAMVEAVGMPGTAGRTVCLSTQVGCPVRCTFCASGLEGLGRNLSQGEILEQALWLRRAQGPFQRVVIMGMGEAGFNLDAVLGALDVLMDPEGFGMSARRITLSTVGPRGALPRIAEWGRPVTLALSLHAPEDALRHELVPGVAKRTIMETLTEVDDLFATNGREYTIEYVLLAGVNDSPDQATALADLLFQRRCHVNLIPYNPVEETEFECPSEHSMENFAKRLQDRGVSVTLRRSLGRQADAACGQLRRRQLPPSSPTTEV